MSRYGGEQKQNISIPGLGSFTRIVDVNGKVTLAPAPLTNIGEVIANLGPQSGYIMRETGLSRVVDRNDKIITALANPGAYLAARNQRIIDMEAELNTAYTKEFSRALVLGYSDEDGKKRAMKYVENLKGILLSDIDKDYPMEAIDLAKKRLLKTN